MEKLDQMFWIDQQKLKDITKQFEVELDEGLKKNNQNIVCSSTTSCLSILVANRSVVADEHYLGLGSTTRR
jgi:hypothetical protein